MEFLKLLLVFAAIIVALRWKVSVGITLFGAGLLTALFFQVSPAALAGGYWDLITSSRFVSLTGVIILVTALGALLKRLGALEKLSEACRGLYGGRRTATLLMPPLVGLMPMPGGSLLSAPLVDGVLADTDYPAHMRCAANYWFRHVVEHFMPIYPGMIVSEAVTGLAVGRLALLQMPLALVMIFLGVIFFIRKIEPSPPGSGRLIRPLLGIASTVWPIVMAVVIYAVFRLELPLAVLAAFVLAVLIYRPKWSVLGPSLRKGLSYKLVFLVFGILSFQTVLDKSGAIEALQRLSVEYQFPEQVIIVVVCFAAGILTGMFAAFVALGYSLLAGFLYQPEINTVNILLGYLSGYVGMMLSPAHLCLIVTNEYFGSDLLKVYRALIIPVLILCAAGYLLFISPWPSWI